MLLLPVAFCTPMHKHECDLNIEWGEGANVIICVTTFVTESVAVALQISIKAMQPFTSKELNDKITIT